MFHRNLRRFITLIIFIIFVLISYIFIRTYRQNGQKPEQQDDSYQINEIMRISMMNRYKRDSFLKIHQEGQTSLDHPSKSSTLHYEYSLDHKCNTTSFDENLVFNDTVWPISTEKLFETKKETSMYQGERLLYYVNSNKCKMPRPDPFSTEAMAIFYKPVYQACSHEDDLISVHFDTNLKQYRLQVNNDTFEKITKVKLDESFICYYIEILRGIGDKADERSTYGERIFFNQDILIPRTVHSVYVACFTSNQSRTVQADAFAFIQMSNITDNTKMKVKTKDGPRMGESRKPSVIMLGLDSMSRMNLRRTMPNTTAYLNKYGWFEMQGYNKIGDNTYPNILALLTGSTDKALRNICNTDELGCFDKLPFVWNYFKKNGYKTAYAEDVEMINTFNYLKPGFLLPPVDYYMRPLLVVIEYSMKYAIRFGYKYCVGRRLSISYVLDYCAQLVERFITNATMPAFGYFWSSSITHDHNFGAAAIDDKFLEYLKHYEKLRLFDQAIVILFSDHGHRYGRLRALTDGFLEERLPMLFIWLPAWFREKYPQYVIALQRNRNRLTSPFDLHMTLKHILELGHAGLKLPIAQSCPSCQSLFRPLPRERDCSQAGIREHFCSCDMYLIVSIDSFVRKLARKIIYEMNMYLAINGLITHCITLKLQRIIKAQRKWTSNSPGLKNISSTILTFRLQFETLPRVGIFEATISINSKTNQVKHLSVPNISRLNSYYYDSLCIAHKIGKKFCFCYNRKFVTRRKRISAKPI